MNIYVKIKNFRKSDLKLLEKLIEDKKLGWILTTQDLKEIAKKK